jgi:tRNA-specific 2-thiouridylase
MSGGVDSSVAAALLKQCGLQVIGIGLRLFDEPASSRPAKSCCSSAEMDDARRVAEAIDIPFYVLDFREIFRTHIIDYFIDSYLAGSTPNPCVPCNEIVKFERLLEAARRLGAERLATGHYARVEKEPRSGRFLLRKGVDGSKDQSYFLYSLRQDQLALAEFPMGDINKSETRALARDLGLAVHDKVESQDICFIGPEGYASFILERTAAAAEPGPVMDESGRTIGEHRGLINYTVGQRRGLGVSAPEPMYVIEIDRERNAITVAPAGSLRRQDSLLVERMNYVSVGRPDAPVGVMVRTRYRRPEVPGTLVPLGEREAMVQFAEAQEPTAPGQSVVFYDGDKVLGGGTAAARADVEGI